ncbi:Uncharacterized protein SCF082_LOCUS30364, partial [Durusdinium trenchii]
MDAGYCAECFLLNACWYGLPQSRNRVYIICLNVQHPAVSVNAKDFFANVRLLLQKLYLKAPAEDLLLDNDDEAVMAHLDRLSGERQEQEEQAAQADEKTPGWISLHMTQADKRFLIPVW